MSFVGSPHVKVIDLLRFLPTSYLYKSDTLADEQRDRPAQSRKSVFYQYRPEQPSISSRLASY